MTEEPKQVPDHTKKLTNATDILIEEAKAAGYEKVIDYVKHTFRSWDKDVQLDVLEEMYDDFLTAVQEEQSREPWGKGKWSSNSTFKEYLWFRVKESESRLEELKWLKDHPKPSFQGLVKFLPHMTNVPQGVGEPLSNEDYDFMELVLRKTLELLKMVLQNKETYERMMSDIEFRSQQRADFDLDNLIE